MVPCSVTITGAATAASNAPSSLEEWENNTQLRQLVDLSRCRQFRMQCGINTAGVAGTILGMQYSHDSGVTFLGLDNGPSGAISTVTISLPQQDRINLLGPTCIREPRLMTAC
jgi:hypothetical protein